MEPCEVGFPLPPASEDTFSQRKTFNANIAIERLRHLKKPKGEWTKKSTRKVNRTPYGFFRHALKHVAEREGVAVREIKPNYTSQTCPRCGHISRTNWRGYAYFKCVKCGYEADRDRVASLNIAGRAGSFSLSPSPASPRECPGQRARLER